MKKNIIEKIWEKHVVKSREGYPDVFAIDLCLLHEVTSPQAFDELRRRDLRVYDPKRCFATIDHIISTKSDREKLKNAEARKQVMVLRENCEKFGIELFDMGSGKQGIVHVIGPDLGLIRPGMTIVCGDSHTSTHGAFGALAFGIGTTEVGHVLATSCILQEKPKTMKVEFKGSLGRGVTAKDLILKLIKEIGVGGATGHVIEYCGDVIRGMSMEERMTVCNMSIECGARAGLIAPDEVTFEYLGGDSFDVLVSDEGASYDKVVEIDISELAPTVTWGISPAQSVEMGQKIEDLDEKAFAYTGLRRGDSLEGLEIDYAFVGSCTNGRIFDLRAVAEVLRGKKVADSVCMVITPGSEKVRAMAIEEGLDKVFEDAGAEFRMPGCSMCMTMSGDVVPDGKRCASTTNRNFIGRQGKGSITHLMSPVMAAIAAVEGKIVDVRKYI